MEFIFSLLPVVLFLITLSILDSFRLVNRNLLILCLFWGILAAWVSYLINSLAINELVLGFKYFSRYLAPLVEELSKIAIIVLLIGIKKIGFSIDAAVYGFAAGTGFALAENSFYLWNLESGSGMITWILRGFGTAIMHGGCTALFAMILIAGIQKERFIPVAALSGYFTATSLHSLFNHFLVNPLVQALIIIVLLPLLFVIVFNKTANLLQNWLEIEFSREIDLLQMIRQGRLSDSKAGNYLISLKNYFSPESIIDLYNYFSLYLELSVKAKRNLMLRENGFGIISEPETAAKLTELKQLRKQVGKFGEMALQPLVRIKYRELWKLNLLT